MSLPVGNQFPPPPQPSPPKPGSGKVITIVLATLGGVALLIALLVVLLNSFWSRGTSAMTASTEGIRVVSIDSAAAAFAISFEDVAEAQLRVEGEASNRWGLETRQEVLVVSTGQRFCLFGCNSSGTVTLVLPESLQAEPLDLDAEVKAGSFTTAGAFTSVDIEVAGGRADLQVADAERISLDLAAGSVEAVFTGTPPAETDLDVAAGTMKVQLPDAVYNVSADSAAGTIQNSLRSDATSTNLVEADVAAGTLILSAGS